MRSEARENQFEPGKLWSFRAVFEVGMGSLLAEANHLVDLWRFLEANTRKLAENKDQQFSLVDENRKKLIDLSFSLGQAADKLGFVASASAFGRMFAEFSNENIQWDNLNYGRLFNLTSVVFGAISPFFDEMAIQRIFSMTPGELKLFSPANPLFGDEVDNAFPSAANDISEAGKCLALNRPTAAVMHLMRALESGLFALCKDLGVQSGENWNTLLNQCEVEIRKKNKKDHGADAEQWYSEVLTHFRSIKNAWRNHAMHMKVNYTEQQSEEIFNSVKSFLRHISSKFAE